MAGLVIYKIVNLINDKIYIGSASDQRKRWDHHRHKLNKNIHANQHLQKAWNLYGKDTFAFVVIAHAIDKENLRILEQEIINETKCCDDTIGYNICKSVTSSRLGLKSSPEHVAKIVKANTGKTRSVEHCAKLGLARLGKTFTEEQKLNLRNRPKHTNEIKEKIRQASTGRKHTEEAKARMRQIAKARVKARHDEIFKNVGVPICRG